MRPMERGGDLYPKPRYACVGFYEVSPLRGFNSMPASLLRSDWVYPSATSWHLTLFAAQTGEDTTDS